MRKTLFYSLFFSSLICTGCGESDFFCGASKNKGIILESITFDHGCMSYFRDQHFIVDSQAALDSLIALDDCYFEIDPPDINFAETTLLGIYTDGGGCEVSYIRRVEKQSEDRKYVYTVKVKECGLCEMYAYSMNWVLVPELPEGWMVEFIVSHP